MVREINIRRPIKPDLPSFKRVAAYVRVSSLKDAMLQSLSNQVSYYNDFIQHHAGWRFAGVYVDEGFTGTKDMRPEFQRLLVDCKSGMIDMVVTKSTTRFARNTVTMLETVRMLKEFSVDVFFEKENIHSMSGDGELMLTILSSFAQEESRSVSENCKWRLQEKMKHGEIVGLRAMYGYNIIKGNVEIDEERAAIVRSIFFDYLSGVGTAEIARRLTEQSVQTIHGGQWTATKILGMLQNEKYTGNALLQKKYVADHLSKRKVRNKGERPKYYAEETHPAIIEKSTFESVQSRIAKELNANGGYRSNHQGYPFSGKIVCGKCGKRFKRITKHGTAYWHCTMTVQFGTTACHSKRIPETTLLNISANVLDNSAFCVDVFMSIIDHIEAYDGNRLAFVFKDGHTVETIWQDHSRTESWTDEMKQNAREKNLIRRQEPPCRK